MIYAPVHIKKERLPPNCNLNPIYGGPTHFQTGNDNDMLSTINLNSQNIVSFQRFRELF